MEKYEISDLASQEFEWRKWQREIPYLQFPAHWKVKIMPPFSGAIVRFSVTTNDKDHVSVYLDCYGMLGAETVPYWEIYPNKKDNNQRFWLHETKYLLEAIEESLKQQLKNPKKFGV